MRDYRVTAFKHGTINNIEAQSIPDGAASDALSWLTLGDQIELSRGSRVIGSEIAGSGRVTGIHTAFKADGTEVYFKAHGSSVYWALDEVDGPWTELGTNILGTTASGEDVFFANYVSLAGAQVWFSSPNSSLFKVMTANPASYTDMYDSTKNFKGYININLNRMGLWGRITDKTGFYGSYIDAQAYTTVTAEATTSLSGTLAFKAAGTKRTCFGVAITITASGEVYTDDYNGVLTGSLGGTGTINYTTGAYTLSNAGVGTADYQWENSNNTGISDFSKSATRTAGQGFVFRQDDGGSDMMNALPIGETMFCLHEHRSWALTLTATDTAATNYIFRQNVGIPSRRAALATSAGIYFINVTDPANPLFQKLAPSGASGNIAPSNITTNVDLSDYIFDDCCMEEWGDYIVFTGRETTSTVNNRLFIYNKAWGSIDIRDYYVSCLTKANGTLIAGESISNNVVTLFSGFDDSDSIINNYWEGNISDLQIPSNLKKVKKLWLEGNIQTAQTVNIYLDDDHGGNSLVGTLSGSADYVDSTESVLVGTHTVGSQQVGGGAAQVTAFHYLASFNLRLDKFMKRKIRFVATGIGYVSISAYTYHDVRVHQAKLPSKYR